MATNPYAQYKKQSVMTMTQGEMLLKLYDEVLKQLVRAKAGIENKQISEKNEALQKAQRIIDYLRATLDFKYDIAEHLSWLYDYFIKQLVQANVKMDVAAIDEIYPMVKDLRDAFCEADKKTKAQNA